MEANPEARAMIKQAADARLAINSSDRATSPESSV
jgi:hypothetical protein